MDEDARNHGNEIGGKRHIWRWKWHSIGTEGAWDKKCRRDEADICSEEMEGKGWRLHSKLIRTHVKFQCFLLGLSATTPSILTAEEAWEVGTSNSGVREEACSDRQEHQLWHVVKASLYLQSPRKRKILSLTFCYASFISICLVIFQLTFILIFICSLQNQRG